jgi:hypothetical protein
MHLRGIVQTASLDENPPGSDTIEMTLRLQGVGPGQPRKAVIPYAMLLDDDSLDPEAIAGRAFEAEVEQDDQKRWLVSRITFASRVLRAPD